MKIYKIKEEYLEALKHQGYAEGTLNYRGIYLDQFLDYIKVKYNSIITRETVIAYQLAIAKSKCASLTIYAKLSVLHLFLRWLYQNNFIFFDLSAAIHFPKRTIWLPHRVLNEGEIKRFLNLPDTRTKTGIRDKAILELLYSSAIRSSELAGLNLYDLNPCDQTLRVLGKGGKERIVPVGKLALSWMIKYLEEVRKPRYFREEALFIDLIYHSRLKASTISYIIRGYAKASGMNKRITPHTFRHSCATHMLKHGADIRYIQEMLGHASPETTQIYTKVAITDLERVFKQVHPRAKRK